MLRRYYIVGASPIYFHVLTRSFSVITSKMSRTLDSGRVEEDESYDSVLEDTEAISIEEVNRKRDKSKLNKVHRNIMRGEVPPTESLEYYSTLTYRRKLYGRYGAASGVEPGVCWPSTKELALKREFEAVSRPFSVDEMIKSSLQRRIEEKEKLMKREEEITMKLAKLQKWKDDLDARIKKREADALAAKAKKDRLIEEVRRYFGFKVDPRDERFKEMLEKKEKEEKKVAKEAKKKAREAKLLAQLSSQTSVKSSEVDSAKQSEGNNTKALGVESSNSPEKQS